MNTVPVTHSEFAGLYNEFRCEIDAVRHQLRLIELRRQLEMQTAKTRAVWKRGLQAYAAALFANVLAIIGTFYWFAKLIGH
jgi:hypothetical protein